MNKIKIKTVGIVILILLAVISYLYLSGFRYMYRSGVNLNKENLMLFDDSIVNDIDTFSSYTYTRSTDELSLYHWAIGLNLNKLENFGIGYHSEDSAIHFFNIRIWKVKSLQNININEINIKGEKKLENIEIKNCDILDSHSDHKTIVRLTGDFMCGIHIDVDNAIPLDTISKYNNYKGFYSKLRRVLLKDDYNNPEAIFDFGGIDEPVLLIMLKNNKGVFLIMFTSAKQFDKKIIDVLNL
jgi:hypothetical protein